MAFIHKTPPQEPKPERKLTRKEKANALKLAVALKLSHDHAYPFFEVELNNLTRIRADVLAIDNHFKVTIVEIKSSKADFKADKKWQKYLAYCNKFYFCADDETLAYIREEIEEAYPQVGFMATAEFTDVSHVSISVVKPAEFLTYGNFSDPKYLFKLARSNCMFWQGNYMGIRKVDTSLMSPHCDRSQGAQSDAKGKYDEEEIESLFLNFEEAKNKGGDSV